MSNDNQQPNKPKQPAAGKVSENTHTKKSALTALAANTAELRLRLRETEDELVRIQMTLIERRHSSLIHDTDVKLLWLQRQIVVQHLLECVNESHSVDALFPTKEDDK